MKKICFNKSVLFYFLGPGNLGVPPASSGPGAPSIDLPDIPSGSLHSSNVGNQSSGGDDVDFDDLTRRFEELKKKK